MVGDKSDLFSDWIFLLVGDASIPVKEKPLCGIHALGFCLFIDSFLLIISLPRACYEQMRAKQSFLWWYHYSITVPGAAEAYCMIFRHPAE